MDPTEKILNACLRKRTRANAKNQFIYNSFNNTFNYPPWFNKYCHSNRKEYPRVTCGTSPHLRRGVRALVRERKVFMHQLNELKYKYELPHDDLLIFDY
jgi:hypothetical protein